MDNNASFTEEERAEAFRQEHARFLLRQTKALESIRTYVGWLLGITVALVILNTLAFVGAFASY